GTARDALRRRGLDRDTARCPPRIRRDERADDGEVEAEMDQPGPERPRASWDVEQVQETEDRGDQRADDTDRDGPERASSESTGRVRGPRADIEDEARDPRTNRHGHQDRVERVPIGTGNDGDR